jgi:excinuclease ABC subunit A
MGEEKQVISVRGASEGRLQSVDFDLTLESLICFVGRSGSGNRTMGVEVLYAESRRRYMLALSPVEREGLGGIGRVDVESISGLPPAIYLDGREIPFRGSVAGFLQIDGLLGQFLRRFGEIGCPDCGGTCRAYTPEEGAEWGHVELGGERCLLLAPLELEDENAAPGVFRELRQAGFLRIRLGGEIRRLDGTDVAPGAAEIGQEIEVVVDRLLPEEGNRVRLIEGLRNARGIARGRSVLEGTETGRRLIVNQQLTCDHCERTYEDLSPDDLLAAGRRGGHPLAEHVSLKGFSLADIQEQSILETARFLGGFSEAEGIPALLRRPLEAAMEMGVGHLPLGRKMGAISTGEGQRLALANYLSSGLVGVLYIFEGLGAGMGAKDGEVVLAGLRRLVDQGNTVLVLDHDTILLEGADRVWCFEAGEVSAEKRLPYCREGTAEGAGEEKNRGYVRLTGKRVAGFSRFDLEIPLGEIICVTGSSGGGKSAFLQLVERGMRGKGEKGLEVEFHGHRGIQRVVVMESRTGGTRRTLLDQLGLSEYLAKLYAEVPAAVKRGFPSEWFRLDSPGGRCPVCEGRGVLHFDMQFLEDISLVCPACEGSRYRDEILAVTIRGLHMGDLLDMDVERASRQFARDRRMVPRLEAAKLCGLESRLLGEPIARLEKGEWVRLSLARELSRGKERDLILLDRPAGGEHPQDVDALVAGLRKLAQRGSTVLVGENHPALLGVAGCVIEVGCEQGSERGKIEVKKRSEKGGG